MTYAITISADDRITLRPRPARRFSRQTLCGATALAISVSVGAWGLVTSRSALDVPAQPSLAAAVLGRLPAPPRTAGAPPLPTFGSLIDPHPSAGALSLSDSAPLPAALTPPAAALVASAPVAEPAAPAVVAAADPLPAEPLPAGPAAQDAADAVPLPPVAPPPVVEMAEAAAVPVPMPRPAALDAAPEAVAPPPRTLARRPAGRGPGTPAPGPTVANAAPLPDNRSFFEKLFGAQPQPNGPALAYAAPEDGVVGALRGLASGSSAPHDGQTAIYDISAHTVYLPDGTRLEAHSGLGPMLDDPRHVAQKMRGPTPPHLYDLTLRESLFHGVQALRLNPVGGGGVFGRVGLLAHTYMLGPNGDSNGCVSFRNYDSFLQAFRRGQIRRLAVVTHLS